MSNFPWRFLFHKKLAALDAHSSMIDRAFLLPSISPSQAARKVIPTCYQQWTGSQPYLSTEKWDNTPLKQALVPFTALTSGFVNRFWPVWPKVKHLSVDKKVCGGSFTNCKNWRFLPCKFKVDKGGCDLLFIYISKKWLFVLVSKIRIVSTCYSVNSRVLHKAIHRKGE